MDIFSTAIATGIFVASFFQSLAWSTNRERTSHGAWNLNDRRAGSIDRKCHRLYVPWYSLAALKSVFCQEALVAGVSRGRVQRT